MSPKLMAQKANYSYDIGVSPPVKIIVKPECAVPKIRQ